MVVIAGYFNFTKAAEEHNAEALLVIDDAAMAAKYGSRNSKRPPATFGSGAASKYRIRRSARRFYKLPIPLHKGSRSESFNAINFS